MHLISNAKTFAGMLVARHVSHKCTNGTLLLHIFNGFIISVRVLDHDGLGGMHACIMIYIRMVREKKSQLVCLLS